MPVQVKPGGEEGEEGGGAGEHAEGEGVGLDAAAEIAGRAGDEGVGRAAGQIEGLGVDAGVISRFKGVEEGVEFRVAGVVAGEGRTVSSERGVGRLRHGGSSL